VVMHGRIGLGVAHESPEKSSPGLASSAKGEGSAPTSSLKSAMAASSHRLLQAIADLGQSGPCAIIIELGARCAARADGPDRFLAELDDNTAAKEHDVWQLGKRSD
jgi:hypothetical protein